MGGRTRDKQNMGSEEALPHATLHETHDLLSSNFEPPAVLLQVDEAATAASSCHYHSAEDEKSCYDGMANNDFVAGPSSSDLLDRGPTPPGDGDYNRICVESPPPFCNIQQASCLDCR